MRLALKSQDGICSVAVEVVGGMAKVIRTVGLGSKPEVYHLGSVEIQKLSGDFIERATKFRDGTFVSYFDPEKSAQDCTKVSRMFALAHRKLSHRSRAHII